MSKYFLLIFLSSFTYANRCTWSEIQNRPNCCSSDQQAIWSPIQSTVKCVPSASGDSCAWSPIRNTIECCETNQHAVWNKLRNKTDCFTF